MSALKLEEAYNHFKKRYNETDIRSDENALMWTLCIMAQSALEDHYERWCAFLELSDIPSNTDKEANQ